jgi:dihydroneopterin aldolase
MVQKLPTMKITQSSIQLHDMRFYAYHGVMEQERRVGGQYLVTLCVKADLSRAVVSDSVADTVNYAALYEVVAREMAQPSQLLEHVAGRVAQRVLDDFPQVEQLSIRITKCNPPMGADCQGASVTLEVGR